MTNKAITLKMALAIIFFLIINWCSIFAQIGINTDNVGTGLILHIDPARNNVISGVPTLAQSAEDIVIDQVGNVGMGTITPQAKLHIVTGGTSTSPNPQLRIEDGAQLAGRVLTSNAQGEAHWVDYAPGAVIAALDPTGVNIALPLTGSVYKNTKSKISLPPGRWVIIFTFVIKCNNVGTTVGSRLWVRSTIGDDLSLDATKTNGMASLDIEGGSAFDGIVWTDRIGLLTGRCIVNNTSGLTKDYYYLVGDITNYQGYSGLILTNVGALTDNNSMFAFRVTY